MLVYMLSLLCTAIPCAHVINTEGMNHVPVNSAVLSNVHPSSLDYSLVSPSANKSLQDGEKPDQKNGRAYQPTNKFGLNQLNIPVQDEPIDISEPFQDDVDPIVSIKDGSLKGFVMKTISSRPFFAFQGIPFAEPPLGPLRFKAPQKNFPWNSLKDSIIPSPQCIQADYIKQYMIHGQEDCLYLNVYTPKIPRASSTKKLPVMVFIHGGGFFFGSSSIYGPAYMLDQDVVLVSMNYRLGALGFLSTGDEASPGNNGLKDQALALRWVQENIEAFGGNPNSVTIFGESAGASSVHFHFFSPLSRGLFHRGISQSGCATCFWSIDEHAPETANKFGSMLNCTGNSMQMVECLRTKDAALLTSKHLYFLEWLMYPVVVFGPVIEPKHAGAFLSQSPEKLYKQNKVAKVPWISGYNSDEGAVNVAVLFLDNKTVPQLNNEWEKYGPVFLDLKRSGGDFVETANKVREYYLGKELISFENRKLAIDMFGDRYSVVCGLKAMRYHSIYTGQPVYAYHLSYNGKYSIVQLLGQNSQDWGVSHLNDLVYQFNNTVYYPELKIEDEEYKVSRLLNNLWSSFATHGKPYLATGGKQIKNIWEPIEPSKDLGSPLRFLDLNLNPKMIADPFAERDQFWRDMDLVD